MAVFGGGGRNGIWKAFENGQKKMCQKGVGCKTYLNDWKDKAQKMSSVDFIISLTTMRSIMIILSVIPFSNAFYELIRER